MVTFVASTLWIAVFSYLMVWMVRRQTETETPKSDHKCFRWLLVS